MELQIHKEIAVRVPRTKLNRLFAHIVRREKAARKMSRVNLVFSDNKRLRQLNKNFRGLDKPTDVLSFNVDPLDEVDGTFGEVYISVATARRQAAQYKAPLSEELLRLACHGFLHLFGYDHMNPNDELIMKKHENAVLGKVFGE